MSGYTDLELTDSNTIFFPSEPGRRTKLSSLIRANQDLTINRNQVVEIDTDANLGDVKIAGKLYCPNEGDFDIKLKSLYITGLFECGNEIDKFQGSLNLGFKAGHSSQIDHMDHSNHDDHNHGDLGPRTFAVHQGGIVRLIAANPVTTYVKLSKTAVAGDDSIQIEKKTNWSVGDEIAIAPSGFDPHEVERRIIKKISNNGKKLHFSKSLKYRHYGDLQSYPIGSGDNKKVWELDERAVVVKLNRKIKIYSTGSSESHQNIGAHMMVMRRSKAYIDGVQFVHMGQLGVMARYPFHWHIVGDASGQYIKNSSVHDSYQRCITVHGTQNAIVSNNICVNHNGHGYFLEDGDEEFNTLTHNVAMLAKRIPPHQSLLASDHTGDENRFSPASSFWISHPNNRVEHNIAAGSEGTGFWMSFSHRTIRDGTNAQGANTLAFNNNIAHSSIVGITWDGAPDGPLTNNPRNPNDRAIVSAHYSPPKIPVFKDLVAFKNLRAGIYFRGETVIYENAKLANNGWSAFFAYNQVLRDSVIVGISENHTEEDMKYLHSNHLSHKAPYAGVIVYDGPFAIEKVDFINFPQEKLEYKGKDYTPIPFAAIGGADRFTNTTKQLRFKPEPLRRYTLHHINHLTTETFAWYDSLTTMSIRDIDGSLIDLDFDPYNEEDKTSKEAGKIIVFNTDFSEHSKCETNHHANTLICDYDVGLLRLETAAGNFVPFFTKRMDNLANSTNNMHQNIVMQNFLSNSGIGYHNKVGLILNQNIEYEIKFPFVSASLQSGRSDFGFVDFDENEDDFSSHQNSSVEYFGPRAGKITLLFRTVFQGQLSPILKLTKLGRNCDLSGNIDRVHSKRAVQRADENTYYKEGNGDIYLRMRTDRRLGQTRYSGSSMAEAERININCH